MGAARPRPRSARPSAREKGVRLAQSMQVGPSMNTAIKGYKKAIVGPTSAFYGCISVFLTARGRQADADPRREVTKIAQGWLKLWANFRALIGTFSEIIGPSLTIWANAVRVLLY